ncbi:MAG: membrane dipeptidase [Pseudomonadales bacterium]
MPGQALREYSALLHGAEANDCLGPSRVVMGITFAQPHHCEQLQGFWQVPDSSCAAKLPSLQPPLVAPAPPAPAEGFADLHNHLLAHVAFGESVFWGAAFGEPATALGPIPDALRGPHQRVEALASSRGISNAFSGHGEAGHPDYGDWPSPGLKTHQQSHVDWLHRAYLGGLRLIVVPAVNNQDMFGRGENRMGPGLRLVAQLLGSGAEPLPHRTSNDMEALEHQVRAAHELAAWVREHRGGWLAIAQTPDEASDLLKAGKLALVLGSEVDHPLNCDLQRRCSKRHIREGLTKLEALGLAVIFPTHHKATQFGDSANFQPLNSGPLRPCPQFKQDCAALGMTDKGAYLIREMMQRGLLVDLGHAGDKPFADSMALLTPQNYPALMTHAGAHPMRPNGSAEYGLRLDQLQQLDALGGMVSLHAAKGEYRGPGNADGRIPYGGFNGGGGYVQSYLYALDALQGAYFDNNSLGRGGQIAFAHDWNGFSSWPYGRFADDAPRRARLHATAEPMPQPGPLPYPIALPANLVAAAGNPGQSLEVMRFGNRLWNFNETGLAHAGLTPDLLADMKLHGLTDAQLDPLYRSARGFVDMWQRARDAAPPGDRGWLRWLAQSPTDLIDFDYLDEDRLVTVRAGVPLCRPRSNAWIGSLLDGVCIAATSNGVQPVATTLVGEIRNANSGYCLTASELRRGAVLQQQVCDDSTAQRWHMNWSNATRSEGMLRSVGTEGTLCAVADGTDVGAALRMQPCGADSTLTAYRIGNTFHLRTAQGLCLQIDQRSLKADASAVTATCPAPGRADFHWEIDALRDAFDSERLFSTRALAGTIEWLPVSRVSAASSSLQYALVHTTGQRLCRNNGQLGAEEQQHCLVADATGSTTAHTVYEVLMAANALISDP